MLKITLISGYELEILTETPVNISSQIILLMGLFVEYSLLSDFKGALTRGSDSILAFIFAKEDPQGQC